MRLQAVCVCVCVYGEVSDISGQMARLGKAFSTNLVLQAKQLMLHCAVWKIMVCNRILD